MTDYLYWDFHEQMTIELDREPTYEEVQERIKKTFTITKEEEKEFYEKKYFG